MDVDMSEIASSSCVNVHGTFVGALLPIKTSQKSSKVEYFEGQLSDGHKTIQVVSFEPKLCGQIEEAQEQKLGVALTNCSIKRSKVSGSNEFKVLLGNKTSILKSPKKFKIDKSYTEIAMSHCCPELRTLELLKDVAEHQHVSVTGKVLSVSANEKISMKNSGKVL